MARRNLDTQGIGKEAFLDAQRIIHKAGHYLQPIDGDTDVGIDGYIRIRKEVKFTKEIGGNDVPVTDMVDTGNLIGVQVKGVSKIPDTGSHSYYITRADKTTFGVNFSTSGNLEKKKAVWKNFIGPMILIFVDLNTDQYWWADLNDENCFDSNGYSVIVQKESVFDKNSFKKIKKLGKELFVTKTLPTIPTNDSHFQHVSFTGNLKETAKELYESFSPLSADYQPIENPTLGVVKYSSSGWCHITRRNRKKMRIFNSLILLGVTRAIIQQVDKFSAVKKGVARPSGRYLKKADYVTLRAKVDFNHRQSSIVQVVLRRIQIFDKIHPERKIPDEVYFHSVYEPYRKE